MVGRTLTGLIPLFLVLVLLPSVTHGDAPKNTTTLNAVGQIGGPIQGVAVQDSIAYVTVGPRLMVMQVEESGSLTEIGGTPALPQFLRDVAVSGNTAYVAAGEAGFYVVDVSNQSTPTVVGSWNSPGYAEAVVVVGTTLYVADGPYGLRTVDVSDPANPVEIGWAFPLHYAIDVAVSDGIAAIASVTAGLFIADISDPADPVEQGSLMTNGCALGVDIDGRTVYLADGWGGLVTVDISRPWMPEILASYETPGWAMDVDVEDGVAFVGDGYRGLRVVDVSDPAAPEELSALEFTGHAVRVSVSGDRVFLVDKPSKLKVIDIFDTFNPTQLSAFASAGQVEDVAVSGDYAYLASGTSGMHVVEVSDPSAPRHITQFDTEGYARNISIVGNHALVTTFTVPQGLEILDVSDPVHPHRVSFFSTAHPTYFDLEISGNIAFMADELGLVAVDFSDPAQPFECGWIDLDGHGSRSGTTGVGLQGDLAAVAQTESGTVFLDISDPTNMTVLSMIESDWAWNATLRTDTAYIADRGLLVLDASDPINPEEVSFAPWPGGHGRDVILDAMVAYLTTGDTGILAFDVSDPRDPVMVAGYDSLGFSNKGVVEDGLLFVADGAGGLIILEPLASDELIVFSQQFSKRSSRTNRTQRTNVGRPHGPRTEQFESERSLRDSRSRIERPWQIRQREILRSLRANEGRINSPHKESGQTPKADISSSRTKTNTCQVTSTADSGSGSLRWCMEQAQSGDTIVFDPAVFPTNDPATIRLSSELPVIDQGRLTIDASESGVSLDCQDLEIVGISIGSDANTVRGLQIYRCGGPGIQIFGNWNVIGGDRSIGSGPVGQGNVLSENGGGISVWGCSHNIISGNLIGTDVTGRHASGNEDEGISVRAGHDNLIGGSESGERNIVSANGGPGISIGPGFGTQNNSYENWIIGNYIGTDIDGLAALGNAEVGIAVGVGPFGNVIKGNVCSGNFGPGIYIEDPGTSYNSVVGNIIGLDATGMIALGNAQEGIYVGLTEAWFNRVGGTSPEDRNIISGNQQGGINVAGHDQFVLGNYIGTDITGTRAIGNRDGITIGFSVHSFVGGTRTEERNVVSGNTNTGVRVGGSYNNLIMGNYIGVDASGGTPLPNLEAVSIESGSVNIFQSNVISGNGVGVRISQGSEQNLLRANRVGVAATNPSPVPNDENGVLIESASNQIGGLYPEDGNVIAHNQYGGVQVWTHPGNSILGNSIFGNNGWGIRLEDGGNNSLSAPEITDADAKSIQGVTCAGCRVDIFSDEDNQGRVYEGSTVADSTGSFEFSSTTRLKGPYITCTATDQEGNTSEFSDPAALTFVRRGERRVSP